MKFAYNVHIELQMCMILIMLVVCHTNAVLKIDMNTDCSLLNSNYL